jgi:hypothetical protein
LLAAAIILKASSSGPLRGKKLYPYAYESKESQLLSVPKILLGFEWPGGFHASTKSHALEIE